MQPWALSLPDKELCLLVSQNYLRHHVFGNGYGVGLPRAEYPDSAGEKLPRKALNSACGIEYALKSGEKLTNLAFCESRHTPCGEYEPHVFESCGGSEYISLAVGCFVCACAIFQPLYDG